jgi:hypothetical protein
MKILDLKTEPALKVQVIKMMYDDVKDRQSADRWHDYKREITYKNERYIISATIRCDNEMFSYRNLIIERPQEIIDIKNTPWLLH